MRDIEFRAWDKEKKKYLTQEEMTEIGGFYYNHGVTPPENMILEQYTGLKDKTGRKIYEGNVLKLNDPYTPCLVKVEYHCLAFMFVGINDRPDLPGGSSLHTITNKHITQDDGAEVIGNIHQTADLLP